MPGSLFEADARRRSLSGTAEGDLRTLCTSLPEVRSWLSRSLESVFRQVPGLAGVFSITASENLTNCVSHGKLRSAGWQSLCGGRSYAELIAEVNTAISEGVLAGNPEARAPARDGDGTIWHGPADDLRRRLPKSCWLMSVSECGVADRAWRSRLGRGRVFAVGCRAGAEGDGPVGAMRKEAGFEDGRQGPSQCFVGNSRRWFQLCPCWIWWPAMPATWPPLSRRTA